MFYLAQNQPIEVDTLRRTEQIIVKGSQMAEIWRSTVVQRDNADLYVAFDNEPLQVTPADISALAEQWDNLLQYHQYFATKEELIAALQTTLIALMYIGDSADKKRITEA